MATVTSTMTGRNGLSRPPLTDAEGDDGEDADHQVAVDGVAREAAPLPAPELDDEDGGQHRHRHRQDDDAPAGRIDPPGPGEEDHQRRDEGEPGAREEPEEPGHLLPLDLLEAVPGRHAWHLVRRGPRREDTTGRATAHAGALAEPGHAERKGARVMPGGGAPVPPAGRAPGGRAPAGAVRVSLRPVGNPTGCAAAPSRGRPRGSAPRRVGTPLALGRVARSNARPSGEPATCAVSSSPSPPSRSSSPPSSP